MNKLTVTMSKKEVTLGIAYLLLQLIVIPIALVLVNEVLGAPLSSVEVNYIFFCLNFLCITVILHDFLIKSIKHALKHPVRCIVSAFLGLSAYWLLSRAVTFLIFFIYPEFYNVNDASINQLMGENLSLVSFGTVVLVPLTEELLYRGLIFRPLYNKSPLAGYVISTFIFSALHVVSYIGSYSPLHLALCFLQYLPASICLGWAYARSDSIWSPVMIHMTINFIGALSMR